MSFVAGASRKQGERFGGEGGALSPPPTWAAEDSAVGLEGRWVSRARVNPWDPAQKEPGLTAAQHLDCSERRDVRAEDRDIWG